MSAAPTPGELAYVAYVRVRYGMPEADAALTYAGSIPEERAAWETAAQAVRQQAIAETLEAQRLLAQAVRQMPTATSQGIVDAINARERASLEERRRQAEDAP